MTTALFTHPDCENHDMPGHPEQPGRLRAIMERLTSSGITSQVDNRLAEEISLDKLCLVHSTEFVNAVVDASPGEGLILLDPDTFMGPGSLRAARLAAGACASATEAVLKGEIDQAFCATRPPGHHAEVTAAMGFCLFNTVAVAAEIALQDPSVKRVAIVDFDVHHCNGTVDMFKDREEVLVISSFQDQFYPYRYLDYENAHIIATPLQQGTEGNEFRARVEKEWLPALQTFSPDFVLVSAGFDAHVADPIGGLCFDESDYIWVTDLIRDQARVSANGRLVSTLEGGYDLEAQASSVEAHMSSLLN